MKKFHNLLSGAFAKGRSRSWSPDLSSPLPPLSAPLASARNPAPTAGAAATPGTLIFPAPAMEAARRAALRLPCSSRDLSAWLTMLLTEPALSLLACCPVGGSVEVGRLLSSGARGHPAPQADSPALERAASGRAIDLGRHPILGQEPRAPPGLPGPAEGRCSPHDILC